MTHEVGAQSPGEVAPLDSLTLQQSQGEEAGRWGGGGGHSGEGGGGGAPFIWGLADPSPLPLGSSGTFPLANSHRNESLPRYTEEKENKTPKKQNKIIPALGGERNKQTPGLRSPRTGGSLQPAPRGKEANSVPCCSAQGRRLSCPETPTHWPLVSFFLSFFFLFDTQTINFQKISFSLKKKKSQLWQQTPGLASLPGGLLSHRLCSQSPAWHLQGDCLTDGSPWTALLTSGWALNAGETTKKRKTEIRLRFL